MRGVVSVYCLAVMPAQAGIQWFVRHVLARRAGMCLLPPPSFRRRPESRGGVKPKCQGGAYFCRAERHLIGLSFPPCGNVLNQPLDSSLRWNDDGGGVGFVAIPTAPLLCLAKRGRSPCRHSSAGPPAWMQGVRRAQPSRGRAASGISRRGGRAASGTGRRGGP